MDNKIPIDHGKTLKLYDWTAVKDKLHRDKKIPTIKDGQVWWCAIGENVGVEENGKGSSYSRPVLIARKLNKNSFVGIPLTSVVQHGTAFVNFYLKGNLETGILSQMRTISVCRLYDLYGEVTSFVLQDIRRAIRQLFI